jgi:ferredoxin-NADP reductase/fatty acid desaturase
MNSLTSDSVLQPLDKTGEQVRPVWVPYATGIAWQSIGLFFVVVVGYVSLISAVYLQKIGLGEACLLASLLLYLGFTVVHEAGHGNIAHDVSWMKPVERAMGWVMTQFFLVIPFGLFAKIHDYHHAFTNDPDRDPDYWVAGDNWWQASLRAPTLAFSYLFATIGRFRNDPVIRKTHPGSVVYYAISLAIITGLLVSGYGLELLMVGILPIFISSYVLAMLFDWIPHKPSNQQGRYQNTRTYLFPGLRWLTLGQSYHHIHHLYPRVSWYNYHKVFDLIRPELEANNSPIESLIPFDGQPGFGKSPNVLEPSSVDGLQKLTLKVTSIQQETPDAVSITFDSEVHKGLHFQAGQYVTVSKLIDGEFITRCYSLCETPDSGLLTIGVKKVAGGRMSSYLNDRLHVGDKLTVSGPFGDFVYQPSDASSSPLVLIAGGSGITPVLSIAKTALMNTSGLVHLIYANRDIRSVMFKDALEALVTSYPERLVLSPIYEKTPDGWSGESGLLTKDVLYRLLEVDRASNAFIDMQKADFYICGPKPMKDGVVAALNQLNVLDDRIHVEEFVAQGYDSVASVAKTHPVTVQLATGAVQHIDVAETQTILQAAQQQGVTIPHACGVGQCGCCMMTLTSGEVEFLSDNSPGLLPGEKQQGKVLTCQCRALSKVTLTEV